MREVADRIIGDDHTPKSQNSRGNKQHCENANQSTADSKSRHKTKKKFQNKKPKTKPKNVKDVFFFLSLSFLFSKPTNKCCCKKSHISNKSCRALEPLENKTASKSARPCFCFPLSLSETRHRTPCRHSLHQHQLHAKNLKPAS